MKKLLLIPISAILLLLSFTSCKDSKEDEPVVIKGEQIDYAAKAYHKLEKYGLKGDVKTAEKIYYSNARWDNDADTLIKDIISSKIIYEFDKKEILTKSTRYKAMWNPATNSHDKLVESETTYYSYDSKYRLLNQTTTEYGAVGELYKINKTIYIYDDINRLATVMIYKGNEGTEPVDKKIYSMDEYGFIDYEMTVNFRPNYNKSETDEVAEKYDTRIVREIDSKENPTLSYMMHKVGKDAPRYVYIYEYYEQAIVYYDNTTSNNSIKDDILDSPDKTFVVTKLADWSLKGDVKKVVVHSYAKSEWNNETNKIEPGQPSLTNIYEFDKKGVCISNANYAPTQYWDTNTGISKYTSFRLQRTESIEYDSKDRITYMIVQNCYYDSHEIQIPTYINIQKNVVSYDDANKKATWLGYRYKDGEAEPTVPSFKDVAKLKEDGTFNSYSYETYEVENSTKSYFDDFQRQPDTAQKRFVTYDNKENMIESYILMYYPNQYQNVNVFYHSKREITYY